MLLLARELSELRRGNAIYTAALLENELLALKIQRQGVLQMKSVTSPLRKSTALDTILCLLSAQLHSRGQTFPILTISGY